MSMDNPATEFDIIFWIHYFERNRAINFAEAVGLDPWREERAKLPKQARAVVCLTCEENSQEGSNLFSVKGAFAHCKAYCKSEGPDKGTIHGGYKEITLDEEYIATEGGLMDGPGSAYDPDGEVRTQP